MKSTIEAYQSLYPFRQTAKAISSIKELETCIQTELLDELTHPRVRKSPTEKLQLAYLRIDESSLNEQEKASLKAIYMGVLNIVNTF
jgi:hypothetical protein